MDTPAGIIIAKLTRGAEPCEILTHARSNYQTN